VDRQRPRPNPGGWMRRSASRGRVDQVCPVAMRALFVCILCCWVGGPVKMLILSHRRQFTRPHMDGTFFPLRDGVWAPLMDHELNEGHLSEVHLAAMADQVWGQVMRGLDALREFLLTGPLHLPHAWTPH
jgi:hypothetical protein